VKPGGSDFLFLHASSVLVPAGALLFLGHSTAGKSTIARLLGERFPVLADDAVLACRNGQGDWVVADGRFRFDVGPYSPRWDEVVESRPSPESLPPLVGCVRIHKADEVRAAHLPPLENCRCLMDAAMEVDLQRKFREEKSPAPPDRVLSARELQLRRHWFGLAADIARKRPGWSLWFAKDRDLDALFSTIVALVAEGRCLDPGEAGPPRA